MCINVLIIFQIAFSPPDRALRVTLRHKSKLASKEIFFSTFNDAARALYMEKRSHIRKGPTHWTFFTQFCSEKYTLIKRYYQKVFLSQFSDQCIQKC